MITIHNGAFQDAEGNLLVGGSLVLQLTADAQAPTGQIVSGLPITITLDASGNAPSTQIWSNQELNPLGTGYTARLFDVSGRPVTNPQVWVFSQTVGTTVDLGTIVPSISTGYALSSTNTVVYVQAGETLAAAIARIPSGGGILFIGSTVNLGVNTTIPSNVTLQFGGSGVIVMNGFTLTVNGPIIAGNTQQIFSGVSLSATVTFGAQLALAPVEWFGAIGDWNGSTGTDNTNPIQYCLNAMTAGQALLQAAAYKITAALTISKSITGIVGVDSALANTTLYATPVVSTLVQTTAGANVITAAGVNSSNNIAFNVFKNIRLTRSVLPTGTASGLSLSFSYGARVDNVVAEDHINGFYLHGVGSQGTGYIQNCSAVWGYNGITETSGTLSGFQVDSTDGTPSNSLRVRNVFAAANFAHSGSITTSAVWLNGSQIHDFHSFHVEAATVDYGFNINSSSSVFLNSADIFISEPVLDAIWVSPIKIVGVQGSVNINGGWLNIHGASTVAGPAIDIQSGSHVSVTNVQFFSSASPVGPCVQVSSTNNGSVRIVGNDFGSNNNSAISLTNTNGSVISNNIANGIVATSIVSITTSPHCVISNNVLNGTATNGILIDNASSDIQGLTTNQIGASSLGVVTNPINDSSSNGDFLLNFQGPSAPVTGNGAPQTIYTYTIPANTIGAGKGFRIKATCNHSTGTANGTYALSVGGQNVAAPSGAAFTGANQFDVTIMNVPGSRTSQEAWLFGMNVTAGGVFSLLAGGSIALTANYASPVVISLAVTLPGTDQVTPQFFMVEQIR